MALIVENVLLGRQGFALKADLQVPALSRVAVIGPSGAGKSTLLDVIAGFAVPTQGRVAWQDTEITALPPQARPVAMLFQDQNLFPHLSVAANLALALRPDGRRLSPAQDSARQAALNRMGLEGLADRKPGALSGGQAARAGLARVLLQKRPIMLLDEPFAALGPALKAEMLQLVQEVAAEIGATTLLVTHAPEDAKRFADRVIVVADGQAFAPVETGPLFAAPPPHLSAYLGADTP